VKRLFALYGARETSASGGDAAERPTMQRAVFMSSLMLDFVVPKGVNGI
jgi:hypothetical protein